MLCNLVFERAYYSIIFVFALPVCLSALKKQTISLSACNLFIHFLHSLTFSTFSNWEYCNRIVVPQGKWELEYLTEGIVYTQATFFLSEICRSMTALLWIDSVLHVFFLIPRYTILSNVIKLFCSPFTRGIWM